MRGSSGILLIALGLIMLYVVLSDKYQCFVQFFDCLTGNDYKTSEGFTKSDNPYIVPTTPPIVPSTQSGGMFDLLRGVIGMVP